MKKGKLDIKEKWYTFCIIVRFFITILRMVFLILLLIVRNINLINFIIINMLLLVFEIGLIQKQKKLKNRK